MFADCAAARAQDAEGIAEVGAAAARFGEIRVIVYVQHAVVARRAFCQPIQQSPQPGAVAVAADSKLQHAAGVIQLAVSLPFHQRVIKQQLLQLLLQCRPQLIILRFVSFIQRIELIESCAGVAGAQHLDHEPSGRKQHG